MLYNVETGERIDTTPDKWPSLLMSGQYNFSPDETIPFKNENGEIIEVPGGEASNYILNPYTTRLRPVSQQEIQGINQEATYGTIGQQLLTGAESLASGGTIGLSRAATKKLIDVTAGEEEGRLYGEALAQRQQTNPVASIAGEVTGLILPGGAASKVVKASEAGAKKLVTKVVKASEAGAKKLVTPAIKGITENKLAQKATEKVGQYMLEGGAIDGAYEFSKQTIDESPYNAEAFIDRTAEGALFNTVLGGSLEATVRGMSKAAKKVGSKTQDYLNKFTDSVDEVKVPNFYEVSGIELDRVETPYFPNKKVVVAEKTPEGAFYNDGKKKVKIDTDGLSGTSLQDKASADSLGAKFDIDGFFQKNQNLRSKQEPLDSFIYRTAQTDQMINNIENFQDQLTPIDQDRFMRAKKLRDVYSSIDLTGKVTEKERQEIIELIRDAEDDIRKVFEKTPRELPLLRTENTPEVDTIFKGINNRKARIEYEKSKEGQFPDWFMEEVKQKRKDVLGTDRELSDEILRTERDSKIKSLRSELKKLDGDAYDAVQDKLDDLEKYFAPNKLLINQYEQEVKRLKSMLDKKQFELMRTIEEQDIARIADELGKFNYIDDGKRIYIDGDMLNRKTFAAEAIGKERQALKATTRGILEQYKPKASLLKRYANKDLNELAQYIKSKYPNNLESFKDVKTPVDYIKNQIDLDISNANKVRFDAIIEMNNITNNLGKSVRLTNKVIGEFVDKVILTQYAEDGIENGKRVLVSKPGMSDKFNAIKKLSDEYKSSGLSIDRLTGQGFYEPLDIKQAIEKRVDLDSAIDWTTQAEKAVNDANKEIRQFIEGKVAERAEKSAPDAFKKYTEAKDTLKKALRSQEIISNAYVKALKDSGIKPSFFKLGLFGSAGAYLGGLPGAIASSAAVGFVDNLTKNYGGNLAAYFSGGIAKDGLRYLKKIDASADKFLKSTGSTRRVIVGVSGNSAREQMQRDQEKFTEELANAEQFAERFIEENDDLVKIAPNTASNILKTAKMAREFLLSKIPENPYAGVPYREKLWRPSVQDTQRYMRYREATFKPSAILDQVSDGYVTPEAAEVLKTIYPETLNRLKEQILNKIKTEESLPLEKRLQIQEIFDIPLESTPDTFQIYQSNAIQSVQQSQAKNNPTDQLVTTGQQTQLPLGDTAL